MSSLVPRLHPSLSAPLAAALVFGACSGGDDGAQPRPKSRFDATVAEGTDGGVDPADAASQPTDCADNPNQCAMFEVVSGAPTCACTGTCVAGYVYDAATATCERFDGGVDAGFDPADTGLSPDSGLAPGQCRQKSDCPGGPDGWCIDTQVDPAVPCSGGSVCECFLACDWAAPVAQSGCPAGAACGFAGLSFAEGLCFTDGGGGTQLQPCTVQYDVNDDIVDDTCNITQNFLCLGTTPQDPTGVCARLCDASDDRVCGSLGPHACEPIPDNPAGLGFCLPAYTDHGQSCPPANCESGVCSTDLGGICSSSCAAFGWCPAGSVCVLGPSEGAICAVECAPGGAGDAACQAIDADLLCGEISAGFGVCVRL